MTFNQFLTLHRANGLNVDAAWRAYDIPGSVRELHTRHALKYLNFAYAGENALSQCMAWFGMTCTAEEARAILGAWWLWSQIAAGRHMKVPKRSHPSAGAEKPA